jgi:glutamine synthetase
MTKANDFKDLDFIKIFTTDINGRIRALDVNVKNMDRIISQGISFDGSSIAGIATIDDSDKLLIPIPESFKILEFKKERVGVFLGTINDSLGVRSKSDTRAVLEKVLEEARSKGFKFLAAPEHEFFLLNSEEFSAASHTDSAGYFHADPQDTGEAVRKKIIRILGRCGIKFDKAHHEVSASQHEINLAPTDPLTAADRTLLVNYVTKKVAKEFGHFATFMPKPFDDLNRSAFHIHISMTDLEGNNLFYDKKAEFNLSKAARQFIGGILKYARETSIIMASTLNSYKAYVLDREAPIIIGWGMKNRSSMVRMPYSDRPENTRIELRNPDPSGNVYLQLAALIAKGMKGMEEGLDCGKPDKGSTYLNVKYKRVMDRRYLPQSMFEALMEAERSKFLKELLGFYLHKNYISHKMTDWEDFRTHVTPREYQKYLSV